MTALGSFEIFLLCLVGCSGIVCGAFLRWGRRRRGQVMARQSCNASVSAAPALSFGHPAFTSTTVDAAVEIRDALMTADAEAARQGVRLEMAVEPDLSLSTNPVSLRAVLAALIGHAIWRTPNGRVLVSGTRLGGRVQIAVMDDGFAVPEAVQHAALREVAEVVALQGGTLEIDATPGEGSVVTVRLPEPTDVGRTANLAGTDGRVEAEAILEWEI